MRAPAKGFMIMSACWLALAGFVLVVSHEPVWDQDWRLYQQMFNGQLTELNADQLRQWQALQAQSSELLQSKTVAKGWYLLSPHRLGQFENQHAFVLRGPQQTSLNLRSSGPVAIRISANPTNEGQWQWQKEIQLNELQTIQLPQNTQLELIAISWVPKEIALSWAGDTP